MNPLGNKEVERAITKETEEAKENSFAAINTNISEAQKANINNSNPQSSAPWQELMEQLQLHYTGFEEEDYNNIMEELEFQLKHARSQYDYKYYEWLLNTTNNIFAGISDDQEEIDEYNQYLSQLSQLQTINMRKL
jgi:hypothetical protein